MVKLEHVYKGQIEDESRDSIFKLDNIFMQIHNSLAPFDISLEELKENYYIFQTLNKGEGFLNIGKETFNLKDKSSIIINCGQEHHINYKNYSDIDISLTSLNKKLIQEIKTLISCKIQKILDDPSFINNESYIFNNSVIENDDKINYLIHKASIGDENLFISKTFTFEIFAQELLIYLFDKELQIFNNKDYSQSIKDEQFKRLNQAIVYIKDNYNTNIVLHDLAKSVGLSKTHFIVLFKKYFKSTPYQYILEYRIKKAKELLLSSNRNISEIAIELGFYDNSAFIKAFSKYSKETPSNYRKLK